MQTNYNGELRASLNILYSKSTDLMRPSYLVFLTALIFSSYIFTASVYGATLKVGESFIPFTLDTNPQKFYYAPNGFSQMISIYPASLRSSGNGKFNFKVIAAGFCPLSIIDIKNKSWYAPKSTAINAVYNSLEKDEHNPACSVSIDYRGLAVKHWKLNTKSTTIVVDGEGNILFIEEGVLNKKSQKSVINLLKMHGKPFSEWPDKEYTEN